MSQSGVNVAAGGGGTILTLTGNSGGAVSPDGFGNINVVGDATTINIAGNPGTSTLTASVLNPILHATQTLNSGQVKALRGSPITIITGPAAGETICIMRAQLKLVYGGTNPFTNPQDMALRYTNGTGVIVSSSITAAGFIDQSANTYTSTVPVANAIVAGTAAEAQAIVLHNTGGSEITGNAAADNTLVVDVEYVVLTQ